MGIKFNNTAEYDEALSRRRDLGWYRWKVYMDESDETLDKVRYVEYLLHPTFPNPRRRVEDRGSRFALETFGWGEFNIEITVVFKDGTQEETDYWLDLRKAGKPKPSR